MFSVVDRLGHREDIVPQHGETVEEILLRHRVPPSSVLVLHEEKPVPDNHPIDPTGVYTAWLIEGYDLLAIREAWNELRGTNGTDAAYVKRRLSFGKEGGFRAESARLSVEEVAQYVEDTLVDTCRRFELVRPNTGLLVGLSGGVDSSALLLALTAVRDRLPPMRLVAVTFEDFDRDHAPTFEHARALATRLDVEYHLAPASLIEETFHLNTPLRQILPRLMGTRYAHHVMYIDHHTTRRALEVHAATQGLDRIALGLHTTDLVAGLLNGFMTGYAIADIPMRRIGEVTYVYPLAFIHKRELHLYHHHRTGEFARHASPNPWEVNPRDRNFYYYLADHLQSYWPCLELMMFTAHNVRQTKQPALKWQRCANCGSEILQQMFTTVQGEVCDVCAILRDTGFVE